MKKDKNVKESDPRNDNALQDKAPVTDPSSPALRDDIEEEILSDEETEIAKKINQAETERD